MTERTRLQRERSMTQLAPMIRPHLALFAALSLVSVGCARSAGPHDDELGSVFFWKVTASTIEARHCGDALVSKAELTPPEIDDTSYFVYTINGEREAWQLNCSSLEPSSCDVVDPANPHVLHDH